MEFDPTEDISFPAGTETITVAFHGQNPITKHPILISYHLKVPAEYVRLQFLKIRDSRGRHPRQRNLHCPSLANSSSPLARLNNITLGSLFSDLRYNVSYQQMEHIRIEPASTSSTNTAVNAPAAPLPSTVTSSNLTNSKRSAPLQVSNADPYMIDGVSTSVRSPQLSKAKPPRRTLSKETPENANDNRMVSVVIPSNPSASKPTHPRTRSQSRKPQGDDNSCTSDHVSSSGSSSSSSRQSILNSSPPSSPPNAQVDKTSSIYKACPVCRKPGELFRVQGQEFVWCDKHFNQSPVIRSSISKDTDVLGARDDHNRRTPKKLTSQSKALASTVTTTQSSSDKRLKGPDSVAMSRKRKCIAVESKKKRRHVTTDEDSSSESS